MSVPAGPASPALLTTGTWTAMTASCTGSAHPARTPNQDAVLVRPLAGGGLVAAVADGHGSDRHARSDLGARFAVELAVGMLSETARGWDLTAVLPVLVDRWQQVVGEHAESHPWSSEEVGLGVSASDPVTAYGSTLLMAVVRDGLVRLAQLGDGDTVVLADGAPQRPVPADPRLVGGRTTSLSLPQAASDVRFAEVAERGCDLVLLATDGLGNSFADRDWWSLLVEDCQDLASRHGSRFLADRLPEWVAESARVGGDDATLAVLLRHQPRHEPRHEARHNPTGPERNP